MWNPFSARRGERRSSPEEPNAGLSEEHLALRRAIERCDALKPAYDAGRYSVADLVETLQRNAFSMATIRKAVEESWGSGAAKEVR